MAVTILKFNLHIELFMKTCDILVRKKIELIPGQNKYKKGKTLAFLAIATWIIILSFHDFLSCFRDSGFCVTYSNPSRVRSLQIQMQSWLQVVMVLRYLIFLRFLIYYWMLYSVIIHITRNEAVKNMT